MAIAAKHPVSASERPGSVVAFVSALGAFSLASFATYYPVQFFPESLLALGMIGLVFGVLALAVWNGSKAGWAINLWIWGALLVRTTTWFVSGEQGALGPGADFNHNMLRFVMAAVLLNLLLTPSLFRWVWRKPEHELK